MFEDVTRVTLKISIAWNSVSQTFFLSDPFDFEK